MYKYEMIVWWSKKNQAYIAEVPELPGSFPLPFLSFPLLLLPFPRKWESIFLIPLSLIGKLAN